jgi:hypothetical protein
MRREKAASIWSICWDSRGREHMLGLQREGGGQEGKERDQPFFIVYYSLRLKRVTMGIVLVKLSQL